MSIGNAGPSPFPREYRASGLLLHVTSLPSQYGIGDVGPAALAWIDELRRAGQSWWQSLPLGPTGYGNSPYQPLSSFAGNELLMSPDWLIEDGLLRKDEWAGGDFPRDAVDYDAVIPYKRKLLMAAWRNFAAGGGRGLRVAYEQFRNGQAHWLEDYGLFRALKGRLDGEYYLNWPRELVERVPASIAQARVELSDAIDQVGFAQFLIFRQGERLKAHAHANGVRLIGDLPFFVSPDSSDVWSNPEIFLLDEQRRPRFAAGVPPDYFSADGQLWGNPVYNWEALRRTGYRWWIDRLRALLSHVDVVRLDHFRGFAAAWHVPAGAPNARQGQWVPGPGSDFFISAKDELGALPFIAEDLGLITPDVIQLRDSQCLPGMRVLQFAFDGNPRNPHLPENYVPGSVVYTGTHDNNTTRGWFEALSDQQKQTVWAYLRRAPGDSREVAPEMMRLAWTSRAAMAIAPLQDLLDLGASARMNVPGQAAGNWRWRLTDDELTPEMFDWLGNLTTETNRFRGSYAGGGIAGVPENRGNTMKATQLLHNLGQSIWLDNITRDLLDSGTLKHYIDDLSVTGLTSNPTIFDHAIKNSSAYDKAIGEQLRHGKSGEELFFELALEDITRAAQLFRPTYDKTNGVDGWVSLEVSPLLAHDTPSTIREAKELSARAGQPNLFIKIPGTKEGLPAIEEAIFAGIAVNVTLLFSREQYVAAAEAFLRGIERRIDAGLNPNVGSVASIFVSRWDVAVSGKAPEALRDRLGIAIAMRTYAAYRSSLESARWERIYNAGARPQRLLWASTGTKDPKASDVLYVKALAAPFTVNTMPEATLKALAEHGELGSILPADGGDCEEVLAQFAKARIDINALAAQLQDEGAKSFVKSWNELMGVIESKSATVREKARVA
jgi:4-alpha-glucanotransferase